MIIIGIDPGVSGGIAVIYEDKMITAYKMPETAPSIYDKLQDIRTYASQNEIPIKAVLEEVHCMPGEGVNSVWTFSGNFHSLKMALYALQIPYTLVSPQKWQKSLGLQKSSVPRADKDATISEKQAIKALQYKAKKDHKNNLKERAQQLFPSLKITLATADALLIAEYGRTQ